MNLLSLQSGSIGNCIYVEAGEIKLLFDAGISDKQAAESLARAGRDITGIDALIISHDHADHIRCAGIYQRKFGISLWVTDKTLRVANSFHDLWKLGEVSHFKAGGTMDFGRVRVETIPSPHDGRGRSYIYRRRRRISAGIFTDLGHVYGDLRSALESVDAALIESNYDPDMLQNGPYPRYLKSRITGPHGHISNIESDGLIARHGARLRWACLGHLSGENNTPDLPLRTHHSINGGRIYHLAGRHGAGEILTG